MPIHAEIIRLETVDSTNAEALRRAAAGAPEWTVVSAKTQTAGRGRLDRKWYSPPGPGLYFSILLRPRRAAEITLIPLAAGLAVVRAIKKAAGVDTRIKWPNDIHVAGDWRKVCGILTEAADAGKVVVVGIGINVKRWREKIPEDVAERRATTLEDESGRPVDRDEVLEAVLREFEVTYELVAAGKAESLLLAVREVHEPFGRNVVIKTAGAEARGVARTIDDEGRFVIELPDGTLKAFVAGDVEYMGPTDDSQT